MNKILFSIVVLLSASVVCSTLAAAPNKEDADEKLKEAKAIDKELRCKTGPPMKASEFIEKLNRLRELNIFPKKSIIKDIHQLNSLINKCKPNYYLCGPSIVYSSYIYEDLITYDSFSRTFIPYLKHCEEERKKICLPELRVKFEKIVEGLPEKQKLVLSELTESIVGWSPKNPRKEGQPIEPTKEEYGDRVLEFLEQNLGYNHLEEDKNILLDKKGGKSIFTQKYFKRCFLLDICLPLASNQLILLADYLQGYSLDSESDFFKFWTMAARFCDDVRTPNGTTANMTYKALLRKYRSPKSAGSYLSKLNHLFIPKNN